MTPRRRTDRLHVPAPTGSGVDRRRLLLGGAAVGAGAVLLGACGDDGDGGGSRSEGAGSGAGAGQASALIAAFPRAEPHVPAGIAFRLPYLLADAEGVPMTTVDGPATFTVTRDGEPVGRPVRVAPRDQGVPRAYLPLTFTFPEPGTYEVVARHGGQDLPSALEVVAPEEVTTPYPGQPLPPVPTPTTTDARGVDPICTRGEQCPYHGVDLSTAVGAGRPVVLLVATPAYCRTAVCGPILDTLIEVVGDRDDLAVVHAEVYANPTAVDDVAQADLAPLPAAYSLTFEPVLYVTDAAGTITARADVTVDRSELSELLPARS